MNLPNKITLARILLIPIFIFLVISDQSLLQYLALFIFLLAALTDSVDGYIARKYNLITDFGKFMDPLADKLLITAALAAVVALGRTSVWVMFIIIAREFIVTGLRLIAVSKGVVIAAGTLGKIKTVVQIIAVSIALIPKGINLAFYGVSIIDIVMWIAVFITVLSGVTYVVSNFHLLNEKE